MNKENNEKKTFVEKLGGIDYSKKSSKDVPDDDPQEEFIEPKPNESSDEDSKKK
jgi:hypothetical protein